MRYLPMLAIYCLLWAAKDVIVKLYLTDTNPVTLTFYLSAFATFYSLLIVLVRYLAGASAVRSEKPCAGVITKIVLLSILTGMGFLALVMAIDLAGPILFSLVDTSFYPIFVALLSYLLLREAIPKARLLGLSIAILGILVFQSSDLRTFQFHLSIGLPFALMASLLFAVAIALVKYLMNCGLSPEQILFFRFLGGTAMLFSVAILSGRLNISPQLVLGIATLALIGYTIPFYMSFYVIQKIPVSVFGMSSLSIPLLSVAFTAAILPELEISSVQIVASVLVTVGLLLGVLPELRRAISNAEQPRI